MYYYYYYHHHPVLHVHGNVAWSECRKKSQHKDW